VVKDPKGGLPDPELISSAQERVLLVEDENSVRELAEYVLRKYGYEVLSCRNLQEAFDLYDAEAGHFHILISDVILPDGNGVELATRLKGRDPSLSVLLTSGYNEILTKWEPFQKLGAPFLQKPFLAVELLRAVREALKMPT